jgi:hypothetical protein
MKFFTLTLWACLFLTVQGISQVDFVSESYQEGLFGTLRDCVVDLNGDFKDDIIGITENGIDIAYQTEDGFEFRSISKQLQKLPLWSICAGDIDANGYNDLMLGDGDRVSFLYADANGSDYNEVLGTEEIFCQRTTFVDIDVDGHLDAFVCNDVGENQPYRNDGNGNLTFDEDMVPSPAGVPGNYISTWTDYDNDGDLDVYLTKCFVDVTNVEARLNLLYNNDGNGNFTEVGAAAGMDDDAQSWVTLFEDFDLDGDFDAYTINHTETNRMKRNNGDGTFTEVIQNTGLNAIPFTDAVETLSADLDNDGDMDIISGFPQVIYYNNGDMTFVTTPTNVRIGALGDMNDDGFIDVVSIDKIYMNQANDNHWIKINPVGRLSNRNAIGCKMFLHGDWGMQVKELRSSASWTPMSTLSMHFGIGQHTSIDSLVIEWPSGTRTLINNPAIDQSLIVDELDCPTGFLQAEQIGNTSLCAGETITLIAPPADSYLWSNGETTQQIVINTTGAYNARLFYASGCDQFTAVVDVVAQNDPIVIDTPDGVEFCAGTPVRLTVDSDSELVWSTGETTKTIWVSTPGEYTADILNACGDFITSEPITLFEFDPQAPSEETIFVTSGSSTALELDIPQGEIVWWTAEVGGTFLGRGALFLDDIIEDAVYYAQTVLTLSTGELCRSARVPITVTVINGGTTGYRDNDADGFGDINNPIVFTTSVPPPSVVLNSDDCDDTRGDVFPGAPENCDNVDNNCDGQIDEGLPTTVFYLDNDGDGFGDALFPQVSCFSSLDGYVSNDTDCDDSRSEVFPDAPEICDELDNNCDGQIDEGLTMTVFFLDQDGDGFGDMMSPPLESCLSTLSGYATNDTDCNDADPTINPDAIEIEGNDIDENCNGSLVSTFNLSGQQLHIYPSPASEFVYIDYGQLSSVEIKVYDLQGRLQLSVTDQNKLDVSQLSEGTYLLTLHQTETGHQVMDRVVVVR